MQSIFLAEGNIWENFVINRSSTVKVKRALSINASLVSRVLSNYPNSREERSKVYLEAKISAS